MLAIMVTTSRPSDIYSIIIGKLIHIFRPVSAIFGVIIARTITAITIAVTAAVKNP